MTLKIKRTLAPKVKQNKPDVVTDCNALINAVVDQKILSYERLSAEREEKLINKMDELINIVRMEYTTNRMLIYLLYAIDVVMVIFSFIHTRK